MRRIPLVTAGLLAGALLAGGVVQSVPGALAAKSHARLGLAAGVVSNLSGGTFTLTRTNKKTGQTVTTSVTLAANAKERALKGTTGALAIGDYAVALGSKGTGGITAERVIYSTSRKGLAHALRMLRALATVRRAAGAYDATASTPTSLVLTSKSGKQRTFAITTATRFAVGGKLVTTAPTFTSGERVVVRFRKDRATHTFVALAIAVKA